MLRVWWVAGLAVVVSLTCSLVFGQGSPKTVYLAGAIQLPGSGGYVDYLAIAAMGHSLYAGYASKNTLVVVDTRDNKPVAVIGGLKDVRGIALVPDLGLGFTSNRGEDAIGVVDLKSNRLLEKIPNGRGPDAIIYDEAAHLVYVANHEGRSATLIDPVTRKITAVVPLGGLAEYAQADPTTGVVYQNLEDRNEIAVVDPRKRAVVARFKIAPGEEPTGLALDAANHRLFSACGNNRLIVLNTDNGKVVSVLPIGSGVDFVAYDPELLRIYTANGGSGTMTVIRQETPDQYVVVENVPTGKGAHALAVDLANHLVYVVQGNRITVYGNTVDGQPMKSH